MADSRYYAVKFAVDFLCVLIVGIPIIIFKFAGSPFKRGFYCDDESIRHPFKDSTVTATTLYLVGTFLNVLAFIPLEYIRVHELRLTHVKIGSLPIPACFWAWYRTIGVFAFGCCVSQLTTDIAKYMGGRLRPHFLEVCNPDPGALNNRCKFDSPLYHQYITEDLLPCRGNPDIIQEARLSFPSGHSSFSAFTMVFLALYLQSRMPWKRLKLLRPTLQFGVLMMAMATGLSRVSDYKHHWSDVMAGTIQGTVVALIIVFFVSDFFKPTPGHKTIATDQDQLNQVPQMKSLSSQRDPV